MYEAARRHLHVGQGKAVKGPSNMPQPSHTGCRDGGTPTPTSDIRSSSGRVLAYRSAGQVQSHWLFLGTLPTSTSDPLAKSCPPWFSPGLHLPSHYAWSWQARPLSA